jgi:hypothetical protein
MASDNNSNNNQPTHTFEDAINIKVNASTHNARSRFVDPPEGL